MSDRLQSVCWCIQYGCPVRTGEAITKPEDALRWTNRAKSHSKLISKISEEYGNGLVDDIYVAGCVIKDTSLWHSQPGCNTWRNLYPDNGYRVFAEFPRRKEQFFEICDNCTANTTPNALAGCAGSFYINPESEALDQHLTEIILRLGLGDEVQSEFLSTKPKWYGF